MNLIIDAAASETFARAARGGGRMSKVDVGAGDRRGQEVFEVPRTLFQAAGEWSFAAADGVVHEVSLVVSRFAAERAATATEFLPELRVYAALGGWSSSAWYQIKSPTRAAVVIDMDVERDPHDVLEATRRKPAVARLPVVFAVSKSFALAPPTRAFRRSALRLWPTGVPIAESLCALRPSDEPGRLERAS